MKFAKRATPTASAAPMRPAPAPATPSLQELQGKLTDTKAKVVDLARERDQLSLDSLLNVKAQQRITEIDRQRQALVAQIETLESAIRTLTQRQRSDWRKHLPHLKRCYLSDLQARWANALPLFERDTKISLLSGRQSSDTTALRLALEGLAELEATVAMEIAESVIPHPRVEGYMLGDQAGQRAYTERKQKADEERAQNVRAAAAELLTMDLRRPPELHAVIEDATKRLGIDTDIHRSRERGMTAVGSSK